MYNSSFTIYLGIRPFNVDTDKEELDNYVSELDRLVEKRTCRIKNIVITKTSFERSGGWRRMRLNAPEILPVDDYVAFSASYVPADN